ncbi:hypothetical protein [uncultured Muriicola sp.]|uniref:hypothetical protein n=1 Tax=uncultured Muriicola sp. TaxID=1583102 RepID=UPI00261D472D|nr:hypothetical protein [uncultured Muriicola sp.]
MKLSKGSISLFLCVFMAIGLCAQDLYQKGQLHLKKGKTIDAYIQINFEFPQRFQQNITYVTPKDYDKYLQSGKLKGSMKEKLNPGDIKGFTLDNGTVFKTVRYADLTGKAIKMIPKKMCLEQTAQGAIEVYKLYSRTTGSINHELADMIFEDRANLINYIQDNFQILVQKDNKNPTNIMQVNLLNYIGDNPRVKENYTNNHYGFRNQFTEQQKMGKYVNKKYEAAFLSMVNDYNQEATEGSEARSEE